MTAYQFANSSVGEDELMGLASAAMDGTSADHAWMGLEPSPTLLEVETSEYFPHFSQVTLLSTVHLTSTVMKESTQVAGGPL